MPQMNKGGKFIFGKSLIREDGTIQLPAQAIDEYAITADGKVYLFTGSKSTGGFCVTRKGLLAPSKLGHILTDTPQLQNYTTRQGEFISYKGECVCPFVVCVVPKSESILFALEAGIGKKRNLVII